MLACAGVSPLGWPHGNFPDTGIFPSNGCSSLGHSNSPYDPVSGYAGLSPGRGLPPRRATGGSFSLLLPGYRALSPRSACLQGDGLGGLAVSHMQGCIGGVVDDGDLLLVQVDGYILGGDLVPDIDPAPGAPPRRSSGWSGEQQVQGGRCGTMRSSRT
jgi:hypothetical protein